MWCETFLNSCSGSCKCPAHIAQQEADDANPQWHQWYHQASEVYVVLLEWMGAS